MTRKKSQVVTEVAQPAPPEPSVNQLEEALTSAVSAYLNADFDGVSKILETSFSGLSADFAAEDADWVALGSQFGMGGSERVHTVKLSRKYSRHDGNCRQMIRLWSDFAIGRGFTWRADSTEHQTLITNYWERRENRRVLSAAGQKTSARRMLVDGEVFFAHFPAAKGNMTTRLVDPIEITDFLVNPEDKTDRVGYIRTFTPKVGAEPKEEYYLDWSEFGKPSRSAVRLSDGLTPKGLSFKANVYLHHIPFEEDESGRGVPLLASSLVYARAYRHFIRARAAIQQAVAMFARKIKGKGSQETLNRILSPFITATNTASETLRTQSPGPGSTWVENDGVDMQPIKMDTGAQSASVDANLYLQNMGVGASIPPHYLCNSDARYLAEASMMEAPTRKAFESFQQVWIDEYRYIFEFLILVGDRRRVTTGSINLDVEAPLILTVDVPRVIHALNEMMNVCPAYKDLPDLHKMIWTHLGAKDTDAIWDKLEPLLEQFKTEQAEMEQKKMDAKNLNGDGGDTGSKAFKAGQQQNVPPADKMGKKPK